MNRKRTRSNNKADKAQDKSKSGRPHGRDTWLHALSTADDPGHRAPALVLYRLLKLSNLVSQPFFAEDAQRYNISMNELRVLMTLAPLREAASHEVGAVAGMHPMNVSRAVAALRRRKRLQQRQDPNNRRRKLLQLTADGWALYKNLMPHVQQVADSLFATMAPEEVDQLSRLLDKMTTRLEANHSRVAGRTEPADPSAKALAT